MPLGSQNLIIHNQYLFETKCKFISKNIFFIQCVTDISFSLYRILSYTYLFIIVDV